VAAKNSTGCISVATVVTLSATTNCSSIGDFVFSDANGNGIQDASDAGISGATVKLLSSTGTVLSTTTTGSNGSYSFNNLAAGTYSIAFTTPSGYTPTLSNTGSNDAKDSDPVNGTVPNFALAANQSNTSVDAGFIPSVLVLGNRVWYDTNNDGINNSSENGMANITVKLYKDDDNNNAADGAAIATKTTDANGYYSFTGLAAGKYIVGVMMPNGYISSAVNGGDPDNNTNLDDNGITLVGNEIRGYGITLANTTEPEGSGNTNNSYDFGLLPDCNCINTLGNLLTNGSFENGTTGWTTSGGTFTTGTGYVACGGKNGFNTSLSSSSGNKPSYVYQDVTVTAGTKLLLTAFAGTHAPGLSCSPKLSMIFRNASGTVLGQTDVNITQNVDANFGQLAYYTITATAPSGTAKVRIQTSISCNYVKMDAFCLRTVTSTSFARTSGTDVFDDDSRSSDIEVSELSVAVSPNPVINYFNLMIRSNDHNTPVDIRILNTDGKPVTVKNAVMPGNLRIEADRWRSGVYFIEVTQAGKRKVVKLVKAN